jgi:hypothetical protein
VAKGRAREIEQLLLSKFAYYIDKTDPDIVILRRQDGALVAAFSAGGARSEGIVEAAKEDYGRLSRPTRTPLGSSRRRRPKEERLESGWSEA